MSDRRGMYPFDQGLSLGLNSTVTGRALPVDAQRIQRELEAVREELTKAREILAQVGATPAEVGYVVARLHVAADAPRPELRLRYALDGKILDTVVTKELYNTVEVGDAIRVFSQSGGPVELTPCPLPDTGEIVEISALPEEGTAEVLLENTKHRVVYNAQRHPDLRAGCRAVVDRGIHVLIRNLGMDEAILKATEPTGVEWHQIGGLTEAKHAMVEAIELPSQHPKLYAGYGKRPPKGLLLEGPPGTGKTMLGKAAASSLARTHKSARPGFFYCKGPELISSFVGATEKAIRQLFEQARSFKREHGSPAVVFFDEADALFAKRGSMRSSDVEKTIVPQFLAEMDGMDESGSLIILATNRADSLDPAVVRDGRIDRVIRVARPSRTDAVEIFRIHLGGKQLAEEADALAAHATTALFDETRVIREVRAGPRPVRIALSAIASGALIAGIVDQATSIALHRDLAAGREEASGISKEDLDAATAAKTVQNQNLNHDDVLTEAFG